MKRGLITGVVILSAVFIASCGGSSGGGGVADNTALEVTEKVSVVDADESGNGSINLKALFGGFKAVADLPAASAYNTDETFTFVDERSAETFSRVNGILCSMAQTQYAAMINQGVYKALIDTTQCDQDKDNAKGAGQSSNNQSSGSNSTSYETWTVNSYKLVGQPHYVDIWIHMAAEDFEGDFNQPAMTINCKVEITEAASDANPIGIFTANFKGCLDSDPTCASPFVTGYLKSEYDSNNDVLIKYYEGGGSGNFLFSDAATLYKDPVGDAGSGSSVISDFNTYEGAVSDGFNFAYNGSYFYRTNREGLEAACLDRDTYTTNVWRYGLYYNENAASPGGRVERNSGFPIKFTSGGSDYHGFAGYYGVWMPGGASLSNGDSVSRMTYSAGSSTETPYTVFVARGRLNKHTKQTTTLGAIKNVPLDWNKCTETGGNWTCLNYRVKWNGTNLIQDAVRSQNTNWMWQDITAATVTFSDNDYSFNFWSDSLGGEGRVDRKDPQTGENRVLSDSTGVIFHRVTTVYPGDAGIPTTLACLEDCIDPATISTADPYFAASSYQGGNDSFNVINQQVAPGALVAGTNYIAYTFDTATMELKYNGAPVVLTDNTNNQYGVWMGSIFELTQANLDDLVCNWDTQQNSTCAWQVWDMDTFYRWETGEEEWNRLTALKDADNQYVSFDAPLMVEYTHPSTSVKYYLEYNGFGDLWGLPGKCVNADTGEDTSCYEQGVEKNIRWVPQISIAAGTAVTNVIGGATYYVKPLEQEQMMVAVDDVTTCSDVLTLVNYTLPTSGDWSDPNIGTESAAAVAAAPAVIGGVVQ